MPQPVLQPASQEQTAQELSDSTTIYRPTHLRVSPDGRWLACIQADAPQRDFSLLLFDAKSGAQLDAAPLSRDMGSELDWTAPNRLCASNQFAQMWKVSPQSKFSPITTFGHPNYWPKSWNTSNSIPVQKQPTYLVQFTTVSTAHQLGARLFTRTVYTGDGNTTQGIEIFDPKTNRGARVITPPNYSPDDTLTLRFSPTGIPRLLVGEHLGEFTLRFSLWEPRSGRKFWEQSVNGLNPQLDFTPDARFLIATQVTGSHGRDLYPLHETLVFNAKTGKRVRALKTQSTVFAESFAGDTLATYGTELRADKKNSRWTSLQLTNWKTGAIVAHLWLYPGASLSIQDIAYAPKAGTLWASREGLVLWRISDLRNGKVENRSVYSSELHAANEEF